MVPIDTALGNVDRYGAPRTAPKSIISVLRELNADLMCLQEVLNAPDQALWFDQDDQIARAFPSHIACFGANRPLRGGTYRNLTLSLLPVLAWKNIDTTQKRGRRSVLMTDLAVGNDTVLHVFNLHLGTGFIKRRYQAGRLMSESVLAQSGLQGARLVPGDLKRTGARANDQASGRHL